MKTQTRSRRRTTAAVVPALLLLSAAWTASGVAPDGGATPADAPTATMDAALTDAADEPVAAPVGLARRPVVSLAARTALPHRVVTGASVADIPAVALAAYQRAAVVIDQADPGCHLDWELLAAIGRVESDHGTAHGSRLGSDGVARPGILGVPLDGRHGTARVRDTDGGFLDGDRLLDHAVGPMQILPSTWVATGVDGDADGQRDPQDVDDASLAAAVQLCFGDDDLATPAGRRAAVHGYNHSDSYVALVLAIRQRYLDHRGLTSLTSSVLSVRAYAHIGTPLPSASAVPTDPAPAPAGSGDGPAVHAAGAPGATHSGPGAPGTPPASSPAAPTPGTPSAPPTTPPGTGTPGDPTTPTGPATDPSTDPTTPTDPSTDPTDPTTPTDPTEPTLPTPEEAAQQCLAWGLVDDLTLTDDPYDLCVAALLDPTIPDPTEDDPFVTEPTPSP
jgi:membrane-bound lytic murein transglycosylase B